MPQPSYGRNYPTTSTQYSCNIQQQNRNDQLQHSIIKVRTTIFYAAAKMFYVRAARNENCK